MAIIQQDYICKNGHKLIYTYSDKNVYIRQIETGTLYADAYDEPNKYTYEETEQPIEPDPEPEAAE